MYIHHTYIIYIHRILYIVDLYSTEFIYVHAVTYIHHMPKDLKPSIQAGSLAPSPSYLQSPLWGDTSQGQRGRGGISPWSVGLNTCANRRPPESTPMWTPQATKLIKLWSVAIKIQTTSWDRNHMKSYHPKLMKHSEKVLKHSSIR